jgi:hypothetical protein
MAAAAAGMAAVGGIVNAAGNLRAGESAAQANEYNAEIAGQNAILARQQAKEEERRARIQGRKQLGAARAAIGASGVTAEGSPLDVLEESARNAELDALTIRHAGEVKAVGFENQKNIYLYQAKESRAAGRISAAGSLLGAGSSAIAKAN